MKKLLIICCTLFASTAIYAAPNCDAVKADIAEKIRANGVAEFSLDVVDKGSQTDREVVGSCGGGTKDIVYQRGNSGVANETSTSMNDDQTMPE